MDELQAENQRGFGKGNFQIVGLHTKIGPSQNPTFYGFRIHDTQVFLTNPGFPSHLSKRRRNPSQQFGRFPEALLGDIFNQFLGFLAHLSPCHAFHEQFGDIIVHNGFEDTLTCFYEFVDLLLDAKVDLYEFLVVTLEQFGKSGPGEKPGPNGHIDFQPIKPKFRLPA